MATLTKKMSVRLNEIMHSFLQTELGEKPDHISVYMNNNILAVYACGVISPAEQALLASPVNQNMLYEYKMQQFQSVKNDLSRRINKTLGRDIKHIHTAIAEEGIRIINIFFT